MHSPAGISISSSPVGGEQLHLLAGGALHHLAENGGIARVDRRLLALQELEQSAIAAHRHFDGLGDACGNMPRIECTQHLGVDEHRARMVEGADEVLGPWRVDHQGLLGLRKQSSPPIHRSEL